MNCVNKKVDLPEFIVNDQVEKQIDKEYYYIKNNTNNIKLKIVLCAINIIVLIIISTIMLCVFK